MRWLIAAVLAASWLPGIAQAQTAEVLILFEEKARHIDLVSALRGRIERAGGRVRHVLGLAGVIADLEPGSRADLAAAEGVRGIYDRTIAAAPSGDTETLAAVAAWNRLRTGTPPVTRRPPGGPPPGGPPTDVSEPPDLPRDPSQLRALEFEYRRHWEELKRNLPPQLQRSSSVGCGTNGAGSFDTSLYLAGDIAVGVFYVNGSSGGWTELGSPPTTASTTQTFADIVYSLDQLLHIQPNARLVFTYVNEVTGAGNPLPPPTTVNNERTYVNDLRNTYCTDWAVLFSVQNGGVWPNAYLHGPSTRLDRVRLTNFYLYDVLHELGHLFGAVDQYAPIGPAGRHGYLKVANANACGNDGSGYFSGAGDCVDDLMGGWGANLGYNYNIGAFSAGQFGWLSSRGDGVLDVTDTKPVVDPATNCQAIPAGVPIFASAVLCSGVAFDRPLLNELPFPYGDVSINKVVKVQYRINTAAWQDAVPFDGVFDSVSEGFFFLTPRLPDATYAVQVQAFNTVGAVTPIPFTKQITVTGSNVLNARPFGSLKVEPERAMAGTQIKGSGAASRDLEPGQLEYSFRWGTGGWTTFSSSATATHPGFTTPGTYTVQMRVKDLGGQIHLVSRSVTVEASDTAPVVALTAMLENQHLTGPNYSLSLSVAGSFDGETPYSQLTVDWDTQTDCKGPWPNLFASAKTKTVTLVNAHFPKSDRRCVRARVTDGTNITEAKRFIWVVPYNHRPSLSVTFALAGGGPDYIATVNATDADQSTSWGGMLEYRFDKDGDGIWDTKFGPTPNIQLAPAELNTLVVEVKDRFHGRVRWSCSTSNPPSC